MITDAIRQAQTDHVVYFLLTAYVESLGWFDPPKSAFPADVTRLPVAGLSDVVQRLNALRDALQAYVLEPSRIRSVAEEAIDIFSAASQRLKSLGNAVQRGSRAPVGGNVFQKPAAFDPPDARPNGSAS
jgi:hypothetical protein